VVFPLVVSSVGFAKAQETTGDTTDQVKSEILEFERENDKALAIGGSTMADFLDRHDVDDIVRTYGWRACPQREADDEAIGFDADRAGAEGTGDGLDWGALALGEGSHRAFFRHRPGPACERTARGGSALAAGSQRLLGAGVLPQWNSRFTVKADHTTRRIDLCAPNTTSRRS
jgi:hypothetical protein